MILPFSIMHSRWILESYLLFPMIIISTHLLLLALKKRKIIIFLLAGIAYGLTFYTYAISYLIISITLFTFLVYFIYLKNVNILEIIAFSLPVVILGLPLFLLLLMNSNIIDYEKINYIGFIVAKLPWFRISELSISNIFSNIFNINYYKSFLFDNLGYNSYKAIGSIFYLNIPVLLFGLYKSIKEIEFKKEFYL